MSDTSTDLDLLREVTVAADRLMQGWSEADEGRRRDLWRGLGAAISEAEATVYPLPGENPSPHPCPCTTSPCREAAMVVLKPGVWCDPCIAPLVAALNAWGIETIASCCGHGRNDGSILLADGRTLTIKEATTDGR